MRVAKPGLRTLIRIVAAALACGCLTLIVIESATYGSSTIAFVVRIRRLETVTVALHAVARNRLGQVIATGRLVAEAPGLARIGRMAVHRTLRWAEQSIAHHGPP